MLVNVKRPADVFYNLDRCGGSQADDSLCLDLLDEPGDWRPIHVRLSNLCGENGQKRSSDNTNRTFEILWSEGVAPLESCKQLCELSQHKVGDYLGYTVRLVNGNETDTTRDMFHMLDEPLVVKPLR